MNVYLKTDGRLFEETGDDPKVDYQPGDVAWFEEDILLVVAIRGGQAEAVEHPDAAKMMEAALTFGPKGPDRVNHGLAEAYRIHGRAGWQRALAACPHPEDDIAPLSGDAWMCVGCGQDVVEPPNVADQAKGVYRKFDVRRTDGSSEPGGKHAGCAYYVLDWQHDPFAVPAVRAYAAACEAEYPALAADLRKLALEHDAAAPSLAGQFGDGRSLTALPGLALAAWVNKGAERDRFVDLLGAVVCNAGLLDDRASFPRAEPSETGKALLDVVYRTVGAPQAAAAAPDLAGQIASLKDHLRIADARLNTADALLRRIVDEWDASDLGEVDDVVVGKARQFLDMPPSVQSPITDAAIDAAVAEAKAKAGRGADPTCDTCGEPATKAGTTGTFCERDADACSLDLLAAPKAAPKAKADPLAGLPEAERARIETLATAAWNRTYDAEFGGDEDGDSGASEDEKEAAGDKGRG